MRRAIEEFSNILRELAFLSELKSENPFKIKALQNSARVLEDEESDLPELFETGEIKNISGVGKGTIALAKEFLEHQQIQEHEALKKEFPETIFELLEVPGLGPKKAKTLYSELSIGSLTELEYACRENRLLELKGFGEKTQQNILKEIKDILMNRGKVILPIALFESEEWLEKLSSLPDCKKVLLSGDLRRKLEVIDCIYFLIEGDEKKISLLLKNLGFSKKDDEYLSSTQSGLPIKVKISESKNFAKDLFVSTGPKEYVEEHLAKTNTFSLGDNNLEVSFPIPELRDLNLSIEEKNLVSEKDIRGIFHMHTKYSDGKNTIEEMVQAAQNLGMEYIGISEHSASAFYANGLKKDRILEQRKEIEKIQKKYPDLRIFHGIESDILVDGSLDYPDSILKEFDFVIASIHGQMKMDSKLMTERIIKAVENPYTTWLGHWTGRILLGRNSFNFDYEKVISSMKNNGVEIELNANPYRLDVDWKIIPEFKKAKIKVGIFPDAHSTEGLVDFRYGVWMARKSGLSSSDIRNTLSADEMSSWLLNRKHK
ncbi:MAG: PHP domain-containing protein [Oligoflexia bacterium]|nr:PHP domain-containing protein [Oligoflexia bacterium]